MLRALLLWALLCAAAVCTARANGNCTWNGYDFSPLSHEDLYVRAIGHEFYLRVCGAMTSPVPLCHARSPHVSACQLHTGVQAWSLGEWPSSTHGGAARWGFITPTNRSEGVQYVISGEKDCIAEDYEITTCEAVVQFVCAHSAGPMTVGLDGGASHFIRVPTPLACAPTVKPQPQPKPKLKPPVRVTGCQWNGYDLSALAERDLAGSDGSDKYEYFLRVCGALSSPLVCSGLGATSACQTMPGRAWELASWPQSGSGVQWSFLDEAAPGRGLQYQLYSNRAECWASGAPERFQTRVRFQCAREQDSKVRVQQSGCDSTFTLATPLACAGAVPGCQWNGYDLSALADRDFPGSDGEDSYGYWLRVCGKLSEPHSCRATAACQTSGQQAWDLGAWPRAGSGVQWSYLDPSAPQRGVQYQLRANHDDCWASGAPERFHTTVQFQCASEQGSLVRAVRQHCQWNMTLATPLACLDTLPSFDTPLLALE